MANVRQINASSSSTTLKFEDCVRRREMYRTMFHFHLPFQWRIPAWLVRWIARRLSPASSTLTVREWMDELSAWNLSGVTVLLGQIWQRGEVCCGVVLFNAVQMPEAFLGDKFEDWRANAKWTASVHTSRGEWEKNDMHVVFLESVHLIWV